MATSLAHLDCQGQSIGAYGYGALADPSSSVFLALTGLLTIFIALFGIRLILGHPMAARDVIGDVIKIGIVLTLATSWPAWRVVGYNLVLNGPQEMARSIGLAAGLPGADGTLVARLQNADDGLVAITMYGTGRLTGGVVGGSDLGDSFHGIAMVDQTGYGWGRIVFLTGIIAPFAITRLGAGLLLAVAPLMAGLLLFGATMGVFVGWLRGLAFVALASLALAVVAGVEIALIDPWIADVLAQRGANTFTPSAPTELTVLAMAFATVNLGILALIGRIAFQPHWVASILVPATADAPRQSLSQKRAITNEVPGADQTREIHSRAQTVADAMANTLRRESAGGLLAQHRAGGDIDPSRASPRISGRAADIERQESLGNSFRRARTRGSRARDKRDQTA
ncbi:type IV secretion system protein [Novosphingobium sp.]|uniref:type IV secretion system protein n=1 Tax=Novosphingobium sp. TaxID=1874826 RepID=UPI003D0FBEFE